MVNTAAFYIRYTVTSYLLQSKGGIRIKVSANDAIYALQASLIIPTSVGIYQ